MLTREEVEEIVIKTIKKCTAYNPIVEQQYIDDYVINDWIAVLDNVDWLEFIEDVSSMNLDSWGDVSNSFGTVISKLDLAKSTSLSLFAEGFSLWLKEQSDVVIPNEDIKWSKWIASIKEYLKKEAKEPKEYQGVTFAEFAEAMASTIQNVLSKAGLHTWVSPNQKSPRVPINMQSNAWYLALLLWRIPIWLGEGLAAGEMLPKEVDPWAGGDTPWSQPET